MSDLRCRSMLLPIFLYTCHPMIFEDLYAARITGTERIKKATVKAICKRRFSSFKGSASDNNHFLDSKINCEISKYKCLQFEHFLTYHDVEGT